MTKIRLLAVLLTLVVLLASCAGDEDLAGQSAVDQARETAEQAEQRDEDIAEAGGDPAADDSRVKMEITEARVEGNTAILTMEVSGIEIVPADGDTSGRTGHFHVFVDTPPVEEGVVIAQGTGVAHTANNPIRFPDLQPGEHTLTVVIGDGNHARILPGVEAEATVTVE